MNRDHHRPQRRLATGLGADLVRGPRSYRGTDVAWYRHATASGDATIRTGAGTYQVSVKPIGEADQLTERIDQAYRTKYARYPSYLPPMPTGQAKATTLRLDPA